MKSTNRGYAESIHRSLLHSLFRFCSEQGIVSWDDIVRCRIKETLDQPFWKLLELNGKYCQEYISEGVHEIESMTGITVNLSSGKWSTQVLRDCYEHLSNHPNPTRDPAFSCQLEHVVSRKFLIQKIVSNEITVDDAIDRYLIGCVVLASEHARLPHDSDSIDDPWQKYRQADPSLRVWSRSRQAWVVG
jgi:hypothetical protein